MPVPDPRSFEQKLIDATREGAAEGARLGALQALEGGIRAEFRAFLEETFGCLDKPEAAAFLGISETTLKGLVSDGTLPKLELLGASMPRFWLPDLKALLLTSRRQRIKLRTVPRPADADQSKAA